MSKKRKRITYKYISAGYYSTDVYYSLDNGYRAFLFIERGFVTKVAIVDRLGLEPVTVTGEMELSEAKGIVRDSLIKLGCAIGREVRKGIVVKNGELKVK